MGDTKNAIRIAKLCGSEYISEDQMLADIDGYEKRNEVNQKVLSNCIQEAAWCIMRQDYRTDEDTIFVYNTALTMLDLLYYDKNKVYVSYIYITLHTELSKILAKIGKYDEMYDQLSLWLDEAISEDSLSMGEHSYENNILINTLKYKRNIPFPPYYGMEYMRFHLGAAEFDAIRETERFKDFLAHAKEEYQNKVINK